MAIFTPELKSILTNGLKAGKDVEVLKGRVTELETDVASITQSVQDSVALEVSNP